jgi:glycosyltransferase involved in cell wall biosynthesis
VTELSVIIPTRDRRAIVMETLARLERSDAAFDRFEVIVVDDGSSDGTAHAVHAFAAQSPLAVTILEQDSAGPSAARNRGVAVASGRACLFLGDDTWPGASLIAHHLGFHRVWPAREAALLGLIVWAPPLDRFPFMRWLGDSGIQFDYQSLSPSCESVGGRFFYASNVSVKTEFLRQVGVFDESFRHAAGEDIDLGLRLERAGMRLRFDAQAVAEHWHPTDLVATLNRMWIVGRASTRLARRYRQLPVPRRPGVALRLIASVLTALARLPIRPRFLREATWRFLCLEAFREAFWAQSDERPTRLPRVGMKLVSIAAEDARHPTAEYPVAPRRPSPLDSFSASSRAHSSRR